jgi:Na+-transporting NADH:ubiquinone oxidoreductase subunit C
MTEDWFREQFRGLSLLRADREGRFFRLLQPGSSSGPGELDAITGATETSRAIERFLNGEIDLFLNALASGAGDKE